MMIGTLIGERYEIVCEVGKGSLGTVYKAKNTESGEVIALKILQTTDSEEVTIKRFIQGVQTARLLSHPNVVAPLDHGFVDERTPFLVTEYCQGQLLSQILAEKGRLPIQRAVAIAVQVCEAIDHAHYFGVVHRNLKPANIMLIEVGGGEQAKVLDFGLSKSFFRCQSESSMKLTAQGDIIGTPEFMSPEQCRGKEDTDWRSDIYSMGCLLYAMLTGVPPIKGKGVLDTLMKQVTQLPPPFEKACPGADVPKAVQDVIYTALRKDPTTRQQTMLQLRDELLAACAAENIDVGAAPAPPANEPTAGDEPAPADRPAAAHVEAAPAAPADAPTATDEGAAPAPPASKVGASVSADDLYHQGQQFEAGKNGAVDFDGAVNCYRLAANAGHREAQFALGALLERARNTQSIEEIFSWFYKAAEQGHPDAQVRVGQAYEFGLGVKRSAESAAEWYGKAAAQGHADAGARMLKLKASGGDASALIDLALGYKAGKFGAENPSEAEKILGRASKHRFEGLPVHSALTNDSRCEQVLEFMFSLSNRGHAEACYWLGMLYQDGRGVQKDLEQAAKWYAKAADQNHDDADLALQMMPPHIVERVKRGRPKWDHRKTAVPFALSDDNKKLIQAANKLLEEETVEGRVDLYEPFINATLVIPYLDKDLTQLVTTTNSAGERSVLVFTEFSKYSAWMQKTEAPCYWSEKPAFEFCTALVNTPAPSIVLDLSDGHGIVLRKWELESFARKIEPLARGEFAVDLHLEGVIAFGKLPPARPSESLKNALRISLSPHHSVQVGFLTEAVFEPVVEKPMPTLILHGKGVGDVRLFDELANVLEQHLGRQVEIGVCHDSGALHNIRRVAHCVYER